MHCCSLRMICIKVNMMKCFFFAQIKYPPGSSFPVCTCPAGYTGNGYGPTGCTQTSDICQTNNPCVNGQCVVSV